MAPEKSLSAHLSAPSPDGALVATVQPGRLTIRSATSGIITTHKLPNDSVARCKHIRWSRLSSSTPTISQIEEEDWLGTKAEPKRRILLSDDDNIRIYDPADSRWKATITSASTNLGMIANVAFGFSVDEVLVFSDFGVKLTIWSLVTSRGVEIKDPKYGVACYCFRPRSGHLALLTRSAAQDVMVLLSPTSHKVLKSVELGTVDAQEVLWSKDGKWIAVSDAASVGHKVFIYTADGQLFKIWTGKAGPKVQLGIKSLVWTDDALVIGDYNDEITLLNKKTFSPLGTFPHLPTISAAGHPNQNFWEEQINASKERSYTEALQPVNPPGSDSFAKSSARLRHGISIVTLNADGSMLATRSDTWPTTIWIWSLATGSMVAALIHHSPVKHIQWHLTTDDLLMIHCSVPEPVVHVWKRTWDFPKVLSLPLERAIGKLEASWIQSAYSSSDVDVANIMLSSSQQYTTAQISTMDGTRIPVALLLPAEEEPEAAALFPPGTGPEDMFDEGHSLDFSPVKISNGTVDVGGGGGGYNEESFDGMLGENVDDTFHYRRNVKVGG